MVKNIIKNNNYSSYLAELFEEVKTKAKNSEAHKSYSAYLARLGGEAIGKKLMEEAFELAVANIEMENFSKKKSAVIEEASDVIYHLMVLLIARDIDFAEVVAELKNRSETKVDNMVFADSKKQTAKSAEKKSKK